MKIKVGDFVQCGVYVLSKWCPTQKGIVVAQSPDGTVSDVDVMKHHGGRPWIHKESTAQLRPIKQGS